MATLKTTRIGLFVVFVLLTWTFQVAQAGIRADLSGDAVVDFATTMQMPLMAVGNPGNAGEWSGESYGGFGQDRFCGAVGYTYDIGKFEVTAGQYTEFLNAVAATDTYGLYNPSMNTSSYGCQITQTGTDGNYHYDFSGGTVEAPESTAADWADRPVNYVSWGDAARFANWLTNGMLTGAQDSTTTEDGSYFLDGAMNDAELLAVTRKSPEDGGRYYIPSEDEWYKAAYHKNDGVTGNYFDYPTSSDSAPSNDLIDPDWGNDATFYIHPGGWTIGSPYCRTEAGDHENSDSPYGTFDMGGNVWEWNETVTGSYRGVRGGSFSNDGAFGLQASVDDYYYPSSEDDVIGFRVVQVPEPATMALLALGGLALLRRRTR